MGRHHWPFRKKINEQTNLEATVDISTHPNGKEFDEKKRVFQNKPKS